MRYFSLLSLAFVACTCSKEHQEILKAGDYTFASFVQDFSKAYDTSDETNHRRSIFELNIANIIEHNANRDPTDHWLGIGPFLDLEAHELPTGFDKSTHRRGGSSPVASTTRQRHLRTIEKPPSPYSGKLPFDVSPVEDLPEAVDWRAKGVTTSVKDQGKCGSCWAFASTAALESHIAIQTSTTYSLSPQELVSCAPNPKDCGGTGGCGGSTGELAYDYVVDAGGMVQEWEFGYASYQGANVDCPYENSTKVSGAVVTISGYSSLERNNYTVLMNAVAKAGPVAISVAADNWRLYGGGVYVEKSRTAASSWDINHLVVVEGYGKDQETGQPFWLIRNSWSPTWGEDGYIRLMRHDPTKIPHPDGDCGMDTTPADGDACTKDDTGKQIVPPAEKVCGTSGVYYSGVIPVGGKLVH